MVTEQRLIGSGEVAFDLLKKLYLLSIMAIIKYKNGFLVTEKVAVIRWTESCEDLFNIILIIMQVMCTVQIKN